MHRALPGMQYRGPIIKSLCKPWFASGGCNGGTVVRKQDTPKGISEGKKVDHELSNPCQPIACKYRPYGSR